MVRVPMWRSIKCGVAAGPLLVMLLATGCGAPSADGGPGTARASTGSGPELLPGLEVTRGQVDQAVTAGAAGDFVGVQVGIWDNGRATVLPYGRADVEHGRPVTAATRFGIGSVTKAVTAVATLQLVAANRITLATPVQKVLPQEHWPAGLTIEHLLAMTSGLSDDFHPPSQSSGLGSAAVQHIATLPTTFSPGAKFRYNNNDYLILGALIERLTGEGYSTVAAHTLGLSSPGNGTDDGGCAGPEQAKPYAANGPKPVSAHPYSVAVAFSAGGLCANAEELLSWQAKLASGGLISANLYKRMTTATPQSVGAGAATGYAVRLDGIRQGAIWIPGFNPDPDNPYGGYSAFMAWLPQTQTGVVVLANTAGPAGGVAGTIGQLLVAAL